jgi:hypothetical protein
MTLGHIRSVSTAVLLCIFFWAAMLQAKEGSGDGPTYSEPKYKLGLNVNEFSILHSSVLSGINKYGGDADFNTHMEKERGRVVYTITIENPRLIEIMGYWAAEKSAELLNSVDFNNLDDKARLSLEATKSLNAKIKYAQANPIWDVQSLRGTIRVENGKPYIVDSVAKYEATGNHISELTKLEGQRILAGGAVKVEGQFEVSAFLKVKDNTLELFVMSQCPFGLRAEAVILDRLDALGNALAPRLDVRYIFYKKTVGDSVFFTSMHGDQEIQEDLVQMVIRDEFSGHFRPYLRARIAEPKAEWKKLASAAGLDKEQILHIEKMLFDEKDRLIESEFNYVSGTYGILDGSPTFVWECQRVQDIREVKNFKDIEFSLSQCSDKH